MRRIAFLILLYLLNQFYKTAPSSGYTFVDQFLFTKKYKNPFELENKSFYMSVKTLDQDDEFTKRTVESVLKFRDYNLFRFSDDECIEVILKSYVEYFETFVKLPFGVMKSDFCRYLMIHHFGGIYIDSDVVIERNPIYWIPAVVRKEFEPDTIQAFIGVEAILPNKYVEYKFYHPYQIVQWSFAANKGHQIFRNCMDDINDRFINNQTYFNDIHHIIELTGPGAMTRSVLKYLDIPIEDASIFAEAPILIKDVYIGPPNTLNCGENDYEGVVYNCNKYTVSHHLYGGRWKEGDLVDGISE